MRISFIFSLGLLLLSSCSINRGFKTLKYPITNKGNSLTLKIPRGYTASYAISEGLDDGFKYRDSSIVYVTTSRVAGVNYSNIENAGQLDSLLLIRSGEGILLLSGVDKNGLYWKNYSYGRYSIGYKNVKRERKDEFDKVISGIRVK